MDGLAKNLVETTLKRSDILPDARRILEIRQQLGKSSVSKLNKMQELACPDGRVRGTMLYHGASTGRWGGKGFQPHNLQRDSYGESEVTEILKMSTREIETYYDDIFRVASRCVRGLIISGRPKKLCAADFSAIEACVLAWIAGETKVLDAFTKGLDNYKVSAMGIYVLPYDKIDKEKRQVGKVCIAEGQKVLTDLGLVSIENVSLAMRVWDGVSFVKHGGVVCNGEKEVVTYDGITATPDHKVYIAGQKRPVRMRYAIAKQNRLTTSGNGRTPIRIGKDNFPRNTTRKVLDGILESDVRTLWANKVDKQVCAYWRKIKRVYDIINCGPHNRFTVSDKLVSNCVLALGYQGWIGAFQSMAVNYGVELDEERIKEIVLAWRQAHPRTVALWKGLELAAIKAIRTKKPHAYGRIKFGIRGKFLHCRLPSGRLLSYFSPWLIDGLDVYGRPKTQIRFMGINSLTKKWERQATYGGKLCENVVSGTARDLLAEAMIRTEKAGYETVLHVHDEIVSENIKPDLARFIAIMSIVPDWAKGCPIKASGWVGHRYRK